MRVFKHIIGAALAAALVAPAAAQVNTVQSTGLTTGYLAKTTYSAAFIGLVPAASATDVICIAGSATKKVRLQQVRLSGSGTAINFPVTLLRRTSVDTGGTAAGTTANPANTVSKRDTSSPTHTATLISYTANPTIVDTSPTYIDSQSIGVVATTVGTAVPITFEYGTDNGNLVQAPTLDGAAAQLCLNFNATSPTALLNGSITWTEE
jgi:hypothetical protein